MNEKRLDIASQQGDSSRNHGALPLHTQQKGQTPPSANKDVGGTGTLPRTARDNGKPSASQRVKCIPALGLTKSIRKYVQKRNETTHPQESFECGCS